jgi:hypothetical protein
MMIVVVVIWHGDDGDVMMALMTAMTAMTW